MKTKMANVWCRHFLVKAGDPLRGLPAGEPQWGRLAGEGVRSGWVVQGDLRSNPFLGDQGACNKGRVPRALGD